MSARPGESDRRKFYTRERGRWFTFSHPIQLYRSAAAFLAGREIYDNMRAAGYTILMLLIRYYWRPDGERPEY
jgi:hypothetical protein